MPANPRRQAAQYPPSPASRNTAKYTNKDGSKFITVPKTSSISTSSETSPIMAQTTIKPNRQVPAPAAANDGTAPAVNRKKQKRRKKEAAKRAAEQALNPAPKPNGAQPSGQQGQIPELEAQFREHNLDDSFDESEPYDPREGAYYTDDEVDRYSGSYDQNSSSVNGHTRHSSNPSGKKQRKKKRDKADSPSHVHANGHLHSNHVSLPVSLPPLPSTNMPRGPGISKEKIWNTSSVEERERIKEFWLSLGEDERKSLVKVEKDAVLKKMKEQQKHSCSCTVCGRKRTAIEEELEVLYDAYYEELETYANLEDKPSMLPPSSRFGAISGLANPNLLPPSFNPQQASRGRIVGDLSDEDDDEEGDEDYSDEEDDEEEYSEGEEDDSEEEEPEEIPRNQHASDFFNFGNSLTVQGGILTVADDLLKNDGKKFIEMMEQLAERRMAREEDARVPYPNQDYGHPPNGGMHSHPPHNHNHPPLQEEEEYDDEDEEEEEYDSQDEDYDEEEMDTMTEEQRMEEGRRMFQIFAARMFEQRVLTAYKEKVASERQQQLLEELANEAQNAAEKQAKKAKESQKKREKAAQKKQALADEKRKRDAEKAEEEEALRQIEAKKLEEQRAKNEERRRKREIEKKALEDERTRKDAEKQRRNNEARERQAELERKQRETKERIQREKEDLRLKEKEAKEIKDREAKERRENQEKEKRAKDARLKAEKEVRDLRKQEELAAQQATPQPAKAATKRPPIPLPASLQSQPTASPHVNNVAPVLPKAPTPTKVRKSSSQPDSNSSVPQTPQNNNPSQNASPVPSTPNQGSPGPIGPSGKSQTQNQFPFLHQPQASAPLHASLKSPTSMPLQMNFGGGHPMNMGYPPGFPGAPGMGPGFSRMPYEPAFPHQIGAPFPPIRGPSGLPLHHPGSAQQMPPGRGFPISHGPPGFSPLTSGIAHLFNAHKEGLTTKSHARHQSGTFDKSFDSPGNVQAQPIARPAPIGRPASIVHGQRHGDENKKEVDDSNNHLGSSALLDDSDEPLNSGDGQRRSSAAPGMSRAGFHVPPFGMDSFFGGSPLPGFSSTWGPPAPNPFGPSSLPGPGFNGGWGGPQSNYAPLGAAMPPRQVQPRSVAVRSNMCRACKNLESSTPDGYINIGMIKDQLDHMFADQPVDMEELLAICETEGTPVNGGGVFELRVENGHTQVRFMNTTTTPPHRSFGPPGEIGSPIGGGISRPPGL